MHITVTSTALNAGDAALKCLESTRIQKFRNWTHVYIDACSEDTTGAAFLGRFEKYILDWHYRIERNNPRKGIIENLLPLWRMLPDDEIIVWLDGDDWLVRDDALQIVHDAHTDGAWVTYGQFQYVDGRPGFASQAGPYPRVEDWRATHLKSFRAGLLRKIRDSDFRLEDGSYTTLAGDQNVMLPCLELAGHRAKFIPEVLYMYNEAHSAETVRPELIAPIHEEVRRVRCLPPYSALKSSTGLVADAKDRFTFGRDYKPERYSFSIHEPKKPDKVDGR